MRSSPAVPFDELWRGTVAAVRGSAAQAAGWLLLLTLIGVAADLSWRDADRADLLNLVVVCAATVAQYAIYLELLRTHVRPGEKSGSFARFVLLAILAALATLLGLVLLIVPGIIVAVRWSAAAPALIAENLNLGDAFTRSWRGTRSSFWPILLLFLVIWVPAWAIAALAGDFGPEAPSMSSSLTVNLALNAGSIASWFAGIAIYRSIARGPGIEEVFA